MNNENSYLLKLSKGDVVYKTISNEPKSGKHTKTWICKTDSFIDKNGNEVVFLEDEPEVFLCKFLDYVM